ncbi:MAG: M20/M25/M40 family metallo-hydrolase, partial [Victivallaceae bacterium]
MNVAELAQSERIWYYFIKMCEICRISGEEANLKNFIADFARAHNLAFQTDDAGNIMVIKERNPQSLSCKTTLLQAHMDMVPRVADGFEFDFRTMPLPLQIDGDMLNCGHKTTLGADNGIGVAAALAVLEDNNSPYGRIKALFTVGEEVGMVGALALDPAWIKDCDQMLNFDSGGGLTVGCAGGVKIHTQLPVYCENYPAGFRGVKVRVSDLAGGHSGCDIHLKRINAIRVLLHLLGSVRC